MEPEKVLKSLLAGEGAGEASGEPEDEKEVGS
jgi:hypothetical protein